jgi:hypothetical protein
MAQFVGRLTALQAAKAKRLGMYADGAGLYLQVSGDGDSKVAKSWIFRYSLRARLGRWDWARYPHSVWPMSVPRLRNAGG